MAWNQPGNNGQDRDPWGSGNKGGNSGGNGNKGGRKRGPIDLDELFRKLSGMLSGNKGGSGGSGGDNQQSFNKYSGRLGTLAIAAVVIVWGASGFYTIKESDRGVVLRFGEYSGLVGPGLNWKPTFIDNVVPVNVETVREQATNGMMLTSDENVIRVEMNVQYRVTDPAQYLFSVTSPDNSLRQALDSAVRGVIGQSEMEQVLTTNRASIRDITKRELESTIAPYKMGITLLDVNFQAARPPEPVKAAFDDVISAREEEQKTIREAHAYRNEVLPLVKGNAQKMIEEAQAYRASVVFKAEGEVASFAKMLPEYLAAPEITRERLYIETMERVLSNTRKIITNDKNNSMLVLPLEQLMRDSQNNNSTSRANQAPTVTNQNSNQSSSNSSAAAAATRGDTTRVGRE